MKKLLSFFKLQNNRNLINTFLIIICSVSFANAQTIVKGVVSDKDGLTLPGVNVIVKNTKTGLITDFDGNFQVDVPSNGILVFSYIGFKTQEVSVNGKTTINVVLEESTTELDAVVVIGYGTQKKEDVNGAISSIKAKDIEDLKVVSAEQMLQGKLAGVAVSSSSGQPGSASSVRVRGITSLSGTNEPLYIIDGVPVSGDATGKSSSGRPLGGGDFTSRGDVTVSPLAMLNPNDIESVDVLKDASATAIYGSRGANGVILITTKSGKKGTGKIAYETYTSFIKNSKDLDVMNLQEYAIHQNALATAFGQEPRVEFSHPELLGAGTDWQDEVYRTAIAKSHQLSFSGSKEGIDYYISGNYLDQEGTIIGSGYKRYGLRTNMNGKVKDWLKVGTNLSGTITNQKLTVSNNYFGIISNTLLQSPDIPVRNPDGSFAGPPANQSVTYYNPVAEALSTSNKLIRKNFLGNFYADLDLFKGLKYRFELGANTEFSEGDLFRPSYAWGAQVNEFADLDVSRQNWYSVNVKNLLTYDRTFSKHRITVLAGQESNDNHWEGISAYATGFLTNTIPTINNADPDLSTVTGYKGSASLYSLFGRIIYDFDNRYGLSASYRGDKSSKFDPVTKKQWGYFPAVALSWKLSNEAFMEGTKKYVDNIKFRLGYGETGNQQIPNNTYAAFLNSQNSAIGPGFLIANLPNPDVTWESLVQKNLGIDFTVLDSKLGVSVDMYVKDSKDFLFKKPLPGYLTGGGSQYGGQDSPYLNTGSIRNKGIEISVNYATDSAKDFSWSTNFVFSKNKNEVLSLDPSVKLFQDFNTNGYQPYTVTNSVVGQPVGQFYGYVDEGLFNNIDDLNAAPIQFGQSVGTGNGQTYLGDVKYKDINGDGVINSDDRTFIGNPNPDFTFGFTNNFKYKNFDLSVFIQGSYGNDILNLTRRAGISNSQLYVNQFTEAANYWTTTNTDTNIPRPVGSTSSPNVQISSRFIEDGSYARIQNLTFGYSLPSDLISKLKLSRLRIYGSVQNLYTFTNYSGYDPEVGSLNQNALLTGIDSGKYPLPRTIAFGMNVEF